MKKIYKYNLKPDLTIINAPIIQFLDAQWQNGNGPVIWAIIDTDMPDKEYCIGCYGTGHPLSADTETYLGTVQDDYGYVWHYFTIDLPTLTNKVEDFNEALAFVIKQVGCTAEEAGTAIHNMANRMREWRE